MTWREKAAELLPELHDHIEESEGVGLFWCELTHVFDNAFERADFDLVHRIHEFSFWCADQEDNSEEWNAVICGFWWTLFRHWSHDKQIEVLREVETWVGRTRLNRICGQHWTHLDEPVARAMQLESYKILNPEPRRKNGK